MSKKTENELANSAQELAVFDYVAGNLSGDALNEFERQLESDQALQAAVEQEQFLRNELIGLSNDESEPVSMQNFDALLERIDQAEQQALPKAEQAQSNVVRFEKRQSSNTQSAQTPRFFERLVSQPFSIAASVVVAGLVMMFAVTSGFLGGSTGLNEQGNEFELLSQSTDLDFRSLIKEGRAAKLVLSNALSNDDVAAMLSNHELTGVGELNNTQIDLYIYAAHAISPEKVIQLKEDQRISDVVLFSFNPSSN